MFYCGKCQRLTDPGEKQTKQVVETRPKIYCNKEGIEVGKGWEIVKEIGVCTRCATKIENKGE
jgi:hypothetical protein